MTNEVEVNFALNLPAVNRIVTALTDGDLYEPPEEKPTGKAILCAAKILGALGKEESASAEIEPFAGELSLIWRANGTKRVKAMFGPDGSYSVYHEQLTVRPSHRAPSSVRRERRVFAGPPGLAQILSFLSCATEESNAIGDIVPDHCVSYRGCSRGTFLNKARDTVMEIAFQKEGKKHKDGVVTCPDAR